MCFPICRPLWAQRASFSWGARYRRARLVECRVECNLSVEHLLGKLSGLPQDDAALPKQATAEAVLRGWHGLKVGPQHAGSGDVPLQGGHSSRSQPG